MPYGPTDSLQSSKQCAKSCITRLNFQQDVEEAINSSADTLLTQKFSYGPPDSLQNFKQSTYTILYNHAELQIQHGRFPKGLNYL